MQVFVNYRREDAGAAAARIRDRLATTFGPDNVFMDVDNLKPGQRFDQELAKALGQCKVFLAVIGQRWYELLHARARAGVRDYMRDEIATALARGITVIPVLIDRGVLPQPDALPEDLRPLVFHQAYQIRHEHFGRDMDALIDALGGKPAATTPSSSTTWIKRILGIAPQDARVGAPVRRGWVLRAALRLSVVVGVVCGIANAYDRYKEKRADAEFRAAYECAARARDDNLLKAQDNSGRINVGSAPFHCARRDFWVAMDEIESVRNGTYFSTMVMRPWWDWQSTAIATAIGFVATNLLGLIIAGALIVVRWVMRPIAGGN